MRFRLGLIAIGLVTGVLGVYSSMVDPSRRDARRVVEHSVSSGVFDTIGYCESSRTLLLTFRGGYCYELYDVPWPCYQELLITPRKGEYFNRRIRGQYACRRVGSPDAGVAARAQAR
jgi:hypothetical protein